MSAGVIGCLIGLLVGSWFGTVVTAALFMGRNEDDSQGHGGGGQ